MIASSDLLRLVCLVVCAAACTVPARVRVATFNTALNRPLAGQLAADLERGDAQARRIAAIVRRTRPDVLLLLEFDHDPDGEALATFCSDYLEAPGGDDPPIAYAHRLAAPVNTGEPSGVDLDGDGRIGGPGDAFGFGQHPGQFGMALLSRLPIRDAGVRTFRELRWRTVPDNLLPDRYSATAREVLRLSSKSHWDVPVVLPGGRVLHVLACHPTPPVFDGPEDRNGRRNHDELRLWADYLEPARATWIRDDGGRAGGLAPGASFVVLGDLNADPCDGDAFPGAIAQLLSHPRIRGDVVPVSTGGPEQARLDGGANRDHRGDPAADTGDFADDPGPGNLRLDYVLPSRDLTVLGAGVFWPALGAAGHELVGASDHRLVWLDLRVPR